MFTFIAHLGTFYYHVQVLSYLGNVDISKHTERPILELKDFLGKYFTLWCFWTQTVLFGVCLVHDVVRIISPKSRTRQLAYWLKNLVFTSLAAPIALAVSSIFWVIWNIDRELVMPNVMDKVIPTWLNHALHTIVTCLTIVELLAERHRLPSLKISVLSLAVYSGAYLVVFFNEYVRTGRWIYPLFTVLDWPGRILFCAGFVGLVFLLLGIFRKVVRITWPEEHLNQKLRRD